MIKYEKINDGYRAYDDRFNWVALSGFGKTEEEARVSFFKRRITKPHPGAVNFNPIA